LASGLLSGKYRKGAKIPGGTRIQEGSDWLTDKNLDIVEKLIKYADAHDHSILDLAVSWLAARPVIASVIAGATKPEQIEANARAAGWKLTEKDMAAIDEIVTSS